MNRKNLVIGGGGHDFSIRSHARSFWQGWCVREVGKRASESPIHVKAVPPCDGLKSSGRRWHDRLHDALKRMGFEPTKAEEDIWIQDAGDHYEYIAVYVNDLLIQCSVKGSPINHRRPGRRTL